MKMHISFEEDKIHFICKGKIKNSREFLSFKQSVFAEITKYPETQLLVFSLDVAPIDLNLLGLLLLVSKTHKIQILITQYSNFRMLEDLFLLEKFNVKYEKGS